MADTSILPPQVAGIPAALDTLASIVTSTSGVIKVLSDLLPNETRSVVVEIVNLTSRTLTKGGDSFDRGAFGPSLPQAQIPAFKSDVFTVESDGFATGVEGSVNYVAAGASDFAVHFDNPFLGSNSQGVKSNTDAQLSIIGAISDGNHAHARYTVLDRTPPFPAAQSGWRSCSKCQGMHFAEILGVCPAGGRHDQAGSFAYDMIFAAQGSDHIQTGWRSCPKCQGMHFADLPDKGDCPAGGKHEQTGSFEYVMEFGVPSADRVQTDWRSCIKCNGLYFGPFKGVCPVDHGTHDQTRSFDYAMRFQT
jgi:hypothetical protein